MWDTINVLFAQPVELLLYLSIICAIVLTMVVWQNWIARCTSVILLFAFSVHLMGWPTYRCPEGEVRTGFDIYNQGIYLVIDKGVLPVYCSLPWNEETAAQLQEKIGEGGDFRYEPSLETRERPFHSPPQPAMPEKPNVPSDSGVGI